MRLKKKKKKKRKGLYRVQKHEFHVVLDTGLLRQGCKLASRKISFDEPRPSSNLLHRRQGAE